MARTPRKDIQLVTYDDILGVTDNDSIDKVVELEIDKLTTFSKHPFKVENDEKMKILLESIEKYGVLNPIVVRAMDNESYEIISGHRRRYACEILNLRKIPAIVRNYTDNESTIIMVDSNIQRENILPSEKAFAYKMKLEAIKHQGVKGEVGKRTVDVIGESAGDNGRSVQRYIRLTELIPELLTLVDEGKIKVTPAVDLSFLSHEEQHLVLTCFLKQKGVISGTISEQLKLYAMKGELTKNIIELLMIGEKKKSLKVMISEKRIQKYFPSDYSKAQIEKIIFELLEDWKATH